jgi:hypothetical protein
VLAAVIAIVACLAPGPRPAPADDPWVKFTAEGNELLVRRDVPVRFAHLEALAIAIRESRPASEAAYRIVRAAPAEVLEYVFAVTEDGGLVVGEQRRSFDFGERTYAFAGGRLDRTYRAVEGFDPWMWLVEVHLTREVDVTLEVRAERAWPVRSVTITPRETPREPPHRRGGSRPPQLAR